MRLLGLDPGLQRTGWGIIESEGNHLAFVADGVVKSDRMLSLAARLAQLYDGLIQVIERFTPDEAAVEETFLNRNPGSTLKLGQARGVVLLAPAQAGLPVHEYAAKTVKKALVGTGSADKDQVEMMVRTLLPGCIPTNADAADALGVAICHAHYRTTANRVATMGERR